MANPKANGAPSLSAAPHLPESIETISAHLSAIDGTGRAHFDYWKKQGLGEPAGGVRYAAELVVAIAEMWRGRMPAFGDSVSLAASRLLLDGVATAAQTLRCQLAALEALAATQEVKP